MNAVIQVDTILYASLTPTLDVIFVKTAPPPYNIYYWNSYIAPEIEIQISLKKPLDSTKKTLVIPVRYADKDNFIAFNSDCICSGCLMTQAHGVPEDELYQRLHRRYSRQAFLIPTLIAPRALPPPPHAGAPRPGTLSPTDFNSVTTPLPMRSPLTPHPIPPTPHHSSGNL